MSDSTRQLTLARPQKFEQGQKVHVFISWSKEPSRTVAEALRDWLPDVIQSLTPWMSSADIGAGARWGAEIADALARCRIGILCVTSSNQSEPWLLFETGALAKTLTETFVCPYLIGMKTADLAQGPLTQFQAKLADRDGTFDLLSTINSALGKDTLAPERLRRLFDRSWPDLDKKLSSLKEPIPVAHRSNDEVLSEVLETVRSIARRLPEQSPSDELPHHFLSLRNILVRKLNEAFPDLDGRQVLWVRDQLRGLPPKKLRELVSGMTVLIDGTYVVPETVLAAVDQARSRKLVQTASGDPSDSPVADEDAQSKCDSGAG